MKMIKKSFVQRAVLLLTFALLFALIAATSVLAGDPDPVMSVIYNPEQCKVYLTYQGLSEDIEMDPNGIGVSVPYGSKDLTVTVVPELGYELTDIEDMDNIGNSLKELYEDCYYNPSFRSSVRANIKCSPKVFDVKFEEEGVTKLTYAPASGNKGELVGLKYYYMQPDNPTVLPVVVRDGYEFKYWQVIKSDGSQVHTITSKTESGQFYIPYDLINDDMVQKGVIYLHAEFGPITQEVIRHDKVFDVNESTTGKLLGTYKDRMPMDAYIDALERMGDDGEVSTDPANPYLNYKSYVGYKLFVDYDYPKKNITIPTATSNPNTFERLYLPIVYTLEYRLDGGTLPTGAPTTYTYDKFLTIDAPTRRGYTFKGWRILVDGVQVAETDSNFSFRNDDVENAKYAAKNEIIVLEAIWEAKKYDITYNWSVSEDLITNKSDFLENYKDFEFDKVSFIPNPTRNGYKFMGWTLTYTDGSATPENVGLSEAVGGYTLDGSLHATEITLTANWQVESYNIGFDADGDGNPEFTISGVEYGSLAWVEKIPADVKAPAKEGYTFDGYWGNGKQYVFADDNGNLVAENIVWDIDGGADGATIMLSAKWNINQYWVTIESIEKIPADRRNEINIIIYVNGQPQPYTGDPIKLDYQTVFYVVVTMPVGFEIVEWNVDDFTTNGNVYTSGNITVGDSDMTLTAKAKPSAPALGGDVVSVRPASNTEIKVQFANATVASRYEVAISLDGNVANLVTSDWNNIADGADNHVFFELDPGTNYYVFVRLKETGETFSGIALVQKTLTEYNEYVESVVGQLNGLLTPNDGGNAQGVIADTIAAIDKLKENMPDDFYQKIQDLIAAVEAKLEFARFQDGKIAALESHREDCMISGSFNSENKVLLNSLCAEAVAKISGILDEFTEDDEIDYEALAQEIEKIYADTKAEMEAIPVTYLYDANGIMQLTSQLGLAQSSGITLNSIEDIKALRRAIADAIAQGNITADSFITIEEATKLLRALDTVRAYSFNIVNVQIADGDVFTLRLTIPEDLIGRTGYQVAYFNQATGMVELLETTVDGNVLVFKAKQIADFVILVDPTVDLTIAMIVLSAILFCQLIAIALVLVSRNKAKNSVMHASVALPLFLTIHFLPVANAEFITLGLGAAVLLAQIVLMWLLLSSGMIRVFKTKKPARAKKEITTAVHQNDLQENPYAAFDEEPAEEDVLNEEPAAEEIVEEGSGKEEISEEETAEEIAEEILDEDAFDEELARELALEQEEETLDEGQVVEEELVEETEEIYDDEEFIESAPNPYYSLDDEEDAENAYIQEETERVSDVDTSDSETEETSYGDDPLDGVFGETDVQDGDSRDEGGDPRYADAYAGAYEYADEADAQTSDADREETSSQGSIDPYAYVVNDDEASDEEELYQYDE